MFASRVERPHLLGATIVVALVGVTASLVPPGLVVAQEWFVGIPYLAGGLLAAVACGWRGHRSTGRYRLFWLLLSTSMAFWSVGQASFLVLNSLHRYTFPSPLDLFIVASNALVCLALLAYPSEPTITRVRRFMDSAMTTLAVALLMWQWWLGPVMAFADGRTKWVSGASAYFPIAGTLMLVVSVVTLTHAPPKRRPLAIVTVGYVLLALGGIWYANMQTDGNGSGFAGLAFNIAANFTLVLAPLVRADSPDDQTRDPLQPPAVTILPYVPLTLALALALVSHVRRSYGPVELIVLGILVGLLLARQYLVLRQNVALNRQVRMAEHRLRHQALHDGLTGLANRELFGDRLRHALALRGRDARPLSLLYADLDGFKAVNDTLGHSAGDQLLIRVAERLRLATRASDTLARFGGDEFAVLLENDADPMASAKRICDVLRLPFDIDAESVRIGCSVGVVDLTGADDDAGPDELLSRADVAMYQAKRAGRGGVIRYRDGMNLVDPDDRQLRDVLQKAMDDGSFSVALQPIVELSSRRVVAVEALARLRHDAVDTRPSAFIAAADRTGILPALTEAVLAQACSQAERLFGSSDTGNGFVAVHLNVLPSQVESPVLLSMISTALSDGVLQPGQLVLEMAETALGLDVSMLKNAVAALRAIGAKIALDDFGFGHSSLSRLGDIEVDILKIDPSVLDRIDANPRQSAIMETLLHLAERLETPVIAQGIERPGQLVEVERLGCRLGQGYLLGRPAVAQL
jgi:diguanylate cyclase (GGDEF)-like protein